MLGHLSMTIKQKLKYWIAFERGHYGAALEVEMGRRMYIDMKANASDYNKISLRKLRKEKE